MHPLPRLKCLSLLQLKPPLPINQIKQIHAQLITNSLKSPSIFATLITHYCATKTTNFAQLVLTHFDPPNTFLLNVLIKSTQPKTSILIFTKWVSKNLIKFDTFTFTFALGACARCCALWAGRQIHARILKNGFLSNIMLQTTCIHFYANNKDIVCARVLFDEMCVRSSVTWNCMIRGYCSQRVGEHARNALFLFRDMVGDANVTGTTVVCVLSAVSQLGVLESGVCVHGFIEKTICNPQSDVYIGTGLVDMYSKCGCVEISFEIFNKMGEKNILTWTAMATGLAIHGEAKRALEVLGDMQGCGMKPNEVTFTSLLSACCHAGFVEEGLCLFNAMAGFGVEPLIQHYGCVVDLLGRSGHLKEAYEFIVGLGVKGDVILWRSLLSACRLHGDVVMSEKVGEVLLGEKVEKNFVGVVDLGEDYVSLSNVYASAERWDDVEMVREVMKVKGIETKPGFSSVYSVSKT